MDKDNSDAYLAPVVAGALGFVTGHVTKMELSVSLAIGGVSAIAGYIASKQSCSGKRQKTPQNDHVDDEEDFDDNEEEAVVQTTSKKKKKKKKNAGKNQKQYKRSSYDDAKPAPAKKAPEVSAAAAAKPAAAEKEEDEFRGMSKSQAKKARRKKREQEKKAAEAKAAAEAKKLAKKKKRQELRKRKKKESGAQAEVDEASRIAALEDEKRRKEEEEGWQQPKEHIRRQAQIDKKAALNEGKKSVSADQTQVYVKVPSAQRKRVFGKKIANINALQDRLGVKIILPKLGGIHDVVTINGQKEQCEKAADALRELMEKGFSQYTNPGFSSAVVEVPDKKIGQMMGSKGNYFRQIIADTGVSSLEKDDDAKIITIIGPAEGVAKAKGALLDLAKQGFSALTHPSYVTCEFPVEADMVPAIIGKGGSNIRRITKATQTRITTPKNGSGVCTIVGDSEKVKLAVEMLKNTIAEQAAPLEPEPTPPEWQVSNHSEEDDWN
mmetsp:Transcript_21656/g.30356  ORF Transcript_21656/g.30356 Transcript_21656/m.30356 type:complete len:494 (+) Transcript_21656:81-1562(+)|eukprot:jgi/Bigna1/85566/estExt_fgenesh1_pg.C_40392